MCGAASKPVRMESTLGGPVAYAPPKKPLPPSQPESATPPTPKLTKAAQKPQANQVRLIAPRRLLSLPPPSPPPLDAL